MVFNIPVHQGVLENTLKNIFPVCNFIRDARKELEIKHSIATGYLEVDIWFPDLKLGFEFQDDYHYREIWYSHVPLSKIQARDSIKRYLLLQREITLIVVPCWWKGDASSLKNTIRYYRPDLLNSIESNNNIIPLNPPVGFFDEVNGGLKVRGLMVASFPPPDLLAFSHTWWLGEKYDGVRCCWNPCERLMRTRRGLHIDMPSSIVSRFHDIAFDAELWSGRGRFIDSQTLLVSTHANWSLFRLVWFDEASIRLSRSPFETRYSFLLHNLPSDCPISTIAPRLLCASYATMVRMLDVILKDNEGKSKQEHGGEGIILRKPHSFYEPGLSKSLFKLKSLTRRDQEALVTDIIEDNTLQLQLPNGTLFKAPIEMERDGGEVKRGDVVTFTFDAHSRRPVPVNPVVVRIRHDLHWPLSSSSSSSSSSSPSSSAPLLFNDSTSTSDKRRASGSAKMKRFLEQEARKMGFDPLIADNWYSISHTQLMKFKEFRTYIRSHNTSISKMLPILFPDIGIDVSKFAITPRNYFRTVQNRRALFEKFARDNGADPLSTEFWYNLTPDRLRNTKGGDTVMWYYGGYVDSVIHLFPEISWDRTKFNTYTPFSWAKASNRRDFFDRFAKSKNFDPLVASNWYSIQYSDFKNHRGLAMIVKHHKGRLRQALLDLYPEIGLKMTLFKNPFQKKH